MSNLIIENCWPKRKRADLPQFGAGDTPRACEDQGRRQRASAGVRGRGHFTHQGSTGQFTVRKSALAKAWSAFSPCTPKFIDKVDLLRSSKVRRAKLYYLRGLRGKAARLRDAE